MTTYRSEHSEGWVDLSGLLDGDSLRALCVSPRSMHSIRPFRWAPFLQALEPLPSAPRLVTLEAAERRIIGGHTTATVRVRRGQAAFRKSLLVRYGSVCAGSGACPTPALEAAHLYSYSSRGEHAAQGGLLLRRDLHRLFDLGLLAIDPQTGVVEVHDSLMQYGDYSRLAATKLAVEVTAEQRRWLALHWAEHRGS